jgi:hypothetical protein
MTPDPRLEGLHDGSTDPHASFPRYLKADAILDHVKATGADIDTWHAPEWIAAAEAAGQTPPSKRTARLVRRMLTAERLDDPFAGLPRGRQAR